MLYECSVFILAQLCVSSVPEFAAYLSPFSRGWPVNTAALSQMGSGGRPPHHLNSLHAEGRAWFLNTGAAAPCPLFEPLWRLPLSICMLRAVARSTCCARLLFCCASSSWPSILGRLTEVLMSWRGPASAPVGVSVWFFGLCLPCHPYSAQEVAPSAPGAPHPAPICFPGHRTSPLLALH